MAKNNKSKETGLSDTQKAGIGAGLAVAALAAAAGGYFLYGSKNAAKNRKTVKSWMLKAKAEVLEGIEKAQKELSKADYEKLVKSVTATYASMQDIKKSDLTDFARDMKAEWEGIAKTAAKTVKATVKEAKKTPAKTVKKVAKKAAQ
jgi:glutamyl-tRNA reductase